MITDDGDENITGGHYNSDNVTTHLSEDNTNWQQLTIIKNIQFCICVWGVIGNIIVIFILSKPAFRAIPHSIICFMLGIVDLYYLIFLMSSNLLETNLNLNENDKVFCKLELFLIYLGIHLDAALIVFLTYERLFGIFWPLRSRQIVTKTKIKLILSLIIIFFVLWNGESIFRYHLVEHRNNDTSLNFTSCETVRKNFYGLPANVFDIKDTMTLIFASFLPMLLIIPVNLAIMIKLCIIKRFRSQLGVNSNEENGTSKMNGMIFTVTSAFVAFQSPLTIFLLTMTSNNYSGLTFNILYLIQTLNPTSNAYLYFLSGKLFREQLLKSVQEIWHFKCIKHDGANTRI